MQTSSILVQNLCVPCGCRCRYCLLSWSGALPGVPWERGAEFARGFGRGLAEERPNLRFGFAVGPSMELPDIPAALAFLREIGSPQAEFWQCDGMRMRSEAECRELMELLVCGGMRHLNFTLYGLEEYHDRFAARRGDFALVLRMLRAAADAGLETSAGVALTRESAPQADGLIRLLADHGCGRTRLSIPHGEGRGENIEPIRFREEDEPLLSREALAHLNREVFRPEREWLSGAYREETMRQLLLSLTPENIGRYEKMKPGDIVAELEALDDEYYAAFPSFAELAERYGDPSGTRYFSQRDLFHHYRRLYGREFGVRVYDVTDERQSGSRRF